MCCWYLNHAVLLPHSSQFKIIFDIKDYPRLFPLTGANLVSSRGWHSTKCNMLEERPGETLFTRPNFRFSECSCQILCSTLSFLYSHSIWHLSDCSDHHTSLSKNVAIWFFLLLSLASFEDMLFFTLFILIVQWLCLGCWQCCDTCSEFRS